MQKVPDNVVDKSLYLKVKKETISRFNSWPSAYASGYLVKEYQRRGGRYVGNKKSTQGLQRWFKEKWIDVCFYPKLVPCGRPSSKNTKSYSREYPYCRPLRRVNSSTPKTVSELSKLQLKTRCSSKHKNPQKRISSQTKIY